MWGFRGTTPSILIKNFAYLGPEKPIRWILYKTNQGTDDHLRCKEIPDFIEGDSIWLEASVSSKPVIFEGGHRFFSVKDNLGRTVKCAAFEPTKDFRHVIDKLEVKDSLIICGSFKKGTINLEKIKLEALAPRYKKPSNP